MLPITVPSSRKRPSLRSQETQWLIDYQYQLLSNNPRVNQSQLSSCNNQLRSLRRLTAAVLCFRWRNCYDWSARTNRWLYWNCSVNDVAQVDGLMWRGCTAEEEQRTSMARTRPGRRRCTSRFERDRDDETRKRSGGQPKTVDE